MSETAKLPPLVRTFWRDLKFAKELESPNAEDSLEIRAAIVGWSYHSPTQDWTRTEFDYVSQRLDIEYPHESLAAYGENAVNLRLFFALGLGYLLGLYDVGKISELELERGEAVLPGVIMLHLPELTSRNW